MSFFCNFPLKAWGSLRPFDKKNLRLVQGSNGSHFVGTTNVEFDGDTANFQVLNDQDITVMVTMRTTGGPIASVTKREQSIVHFDERSFLPTHPRWNRICTRAWISVPSSKSFGSDRKGWYYCRTSTKSAGISKPIRASITPNSLGPFVFEPVQNACKPCSPHCTPPSGMLHTA
jgi:hypothetical protein